MKTIIQKLLLAATTVFLTTIAPVGADDTEIYLGSNLGVTEVKPNVLFIIDTSGSMDSTVSEAAPVYDPNVTYAGSCSTSKIYYSDKGKAPACNTSAWFNESANKCNKAKLGLKNSGFFSDEMAMWNPKNSTWSKFNTKWNDYYVECLSDTGVHGDGINATKLWAGNGASGPWTTANDKGRVNLESVGPTYTLYSGNFLNWKAQPAPAPKTRLDVVKEVFAMLMDTSHDINVAMMRFDMYGNGGYFLTPMLELNDTVRADIGNQSSRTYFKEVIKNLDANGNTPLAETMYEAARFFRGENPYFGSKSGPATNHTGCLDPDKSYKSPMDFECQKNFIVWLTDGDPTSDNGADSLIKAFPNLVNIAGGCSFSSNDDCLDELADYLYRTDQREDLAGMQNVTTYTIGFFTDQVLLSETARKGGGKYFQTDNTSGVVDAFTTIITEILAVNTTFAAPAVTVNAFNRLTHRDELYFALFRPSETPKWGGNIKRYRLGGSPLKILDFNSNVAVDQNTGFFKTTAQSFWTDPLLIDGDDVTAGGASGELVLPRNVYTYMGGSNNLLAASNLLHEVNAGITAAMLGVDDANRGPALQWARGVDLFDSDGDDDTSDIRTQYGDPLHTQPVLVTYGEKDITLFATTNEGFLHAIDTDDGSEIFSFMPAELLPNVGIFYSNSPNDQHPYGLDGPITAWGNDKNKDNTLSGPGEHVYLYLTMRMGGRNIYALDVTNRNAPLIKWVIKGGVDADFSELAQTWSKAVLTTVKFNGTARKVLIFGGGYDPIQEGAATLTKDTMGRAVFMVDAESGKKLWQAGPSGTGANLVLDTMTNSIPSEVRVVDLTGDGFADRMYVGDMGGKVWRFDIKIDNTGASDFATGGVLAELGEAGTEAGGTHTRRFYYPPDVSINSDTKVVNVAIGSGYRGHPLNREIHDRFFVLYDTRYEKPNYAGWTINNLFDIRSPSDTCLKMHGFYLDLVNGSTWEGEKVLAEALTMNYEVSFTTFTPVSKGSACSPGTGVARFYSVKIPELSQCETVSKTDTITTSYLDSPTIPSQPQLVCTEDGCTTLVGTQTIINTDSRNPKKYYWLRNSTE